jgi:hypothetical protein
MIIPVGKRLMKDRLQHLNLKHALDENYSGFLAVDLVLQWRQDDLARAGQRFVETWRG